MKRFILTIVCVVALTLPSFAQQDGLGIGLVF